jgi:hypothetical protein
MDELECMCILCANCVLTRHVANLLQGTALAAELEHLIESSDWEGAARLANMHTADGDTVTTDLRAELDLLHATRRAEFLDLLIASGDWKVVGLVAPYLALNRGSSVDSVDWEGAILDTAKYEAGGDIVDEFSVCARPQAVTTQRSQAVQQYHQQVEDLVRQVVPDELPYIDEMMQQFQGREDELIETLRTMGERSGMFHRNGPRSKPYRKRNNGHWLQLGFPGMRQSS